MVQSDGWERSELHRALEQSKLRARALAFLSELQDVDTPQEEATDATCALAERFQPGVCAGFTIVGSGHFERVTYPSLSTAGFDKLLPLPIEHPCAGTCAQALRHEKVVACHDIATECRFDSIWRNLYLDLGIRSIQSAPIISFRGQPLGTFVLAFKEPRTSFDLQTTGFGVYAMRTILQRRWYPALH